jgi:hypothetical protein
MRRLTGLLLAAVLAALSNGAYANSYSFVGVFDNPNDVVLFHFSLASSTSVTLNTVSYSGGSLLNPPIAWPDGGFDPVLTLYDGSGTQLATNDDIDTGSFLFDSSIASPLAVGSYTLALTAYRNFPVGTLADGFDGGGNSFGGRTSTYAVNLGLGDGPGNVWTSTEYIPAPIPLPAAAWLLGSALLGLLGLSRRNR